MYWLVIPCMYHRVIQRVNCWTSTITRAFAVIAAVVQ
uniref:Uncharacterized protein n=1 Tax=Arundo donax TaxID=35708 RepID=A0A0A9AGA2_ARUDO